VIAAVFNIIIFGAGAAVYLFAVDLIMGTATLPGWLQIVLVWLIGVVGWLLLRPYRRITQMGGKDPTAAITSAGSWHRRFLRDARDAARLEVVTPGGTAEPKFGRAGGGTQDSRVLRPESRTEDVVTVGGSGSPPPITARTARPEGGRRRPAGDWTDPDVPDAPANYTIYRPATSPDPAPTPQRTSRPESSSVRT
jgi:hypothetical protein